MDKNEELIYTDEESGDVEKLDSKTKKLKKQLKQCQKEKEEYLSQAQRARADLINYRRRQEQVLEEFKNFGQINLLREILPVLDSLEAGEKKYCEKGDKGVETIRKQLENVLKKYGVEEIKAVDKEFNPLFHEAVELVESKKKSGMVVEEIQKGYMLNDKILRVSRVKVAR